MENPQTGDDETIQNETSITPQNLDRILATSHFSIRMNTGIFNLHAAALLAREKGDFTLEVEPEHDT